MKLKGFGWETFVVQHAINHRYIELFLATKDEMMSAAAGIDTRGT